MNDRYCFEWVSPNREDLRLLLIGDVFMNDIRPIWERILGCQVDSFCSNAPLAHNEAALARMLKRERYSAVILGEGRHRPPADTPLLEKVQEILPGVPVVLATAAPAYLSSARYRTDAEGVERSNDCARRLAAERHCILFDFAAWAEEMGAGTEEELRKTDRRQCLALLLRGKADKAWKVWQKSMPKRRKRRFHAVTEALAERAFYGLHMLMLNQLKSEEVWTNRWERPGASCLAIGGSNVRRLMHGHPLLQKKADQYTASHSMLNDEAMRLFRSMIKPEHRSIIYHIGMHCLKEFEGEAFDRQLRKVLESLAEGGRRVVLLTVSLWNESGDESGYYKELNELIRQLNGRMAKTAAECGADVVDMQGMLEGQEFDDEIHYVYPAYRPVAAELARLLQLED